MHKGGEEAAAEDTHTSPCRLRAQTQRSQWARSRGATSRYSPRTKRETTCSMGPRYSQEKEWRSQESQQQSQAQTAPQHSSSKGKGWSGPELKWSSQTNGQGLGVPRWCLSGQLRLISACSAPMSPFTLGFTNFCLLSMQHKRLTKLVEGKVEMKLFPLKYRFLYIRCSWEVYANNLSNTELKLWIRIMLFV